MKRKDQLRQLLAMGDQTNKGTELQTGKAPNVICEGEGASPHSPRSSSGAVKAMGLSLEALTRDAETARTLRSELDRVERVLELDPSAIEPSPVTDRLSLSMEADEAFSTLKASIERDGQAVPVLVRPHSDPSKASQGIYQTAYGHRRVAAAAALGRSVKAIVRALSDDELVLAQGKENAERRDLSFIERAFFAKGLVENGFDRILAQAALGVDKPEMSRLLQVAQRVPLDIVRAIGPAPKAGRPRWLTLASRMESEAGYARAVDETRMQAFQSLRSDDRFLRLFKKLEPRVRGKKTDGARSLYQLDGSWIGKIATDSKGKAVLSLDPIFAEYLAVRLMDLHAAFISQSSDSLDAPQNAEQDNRQKGTK